jgi:8-oxo-dGTP diphosphatase
MSDVPTRLQVSAGGVAYRRQAERIEVAIIAVNKNHRWQLPKGLIDEDESPESAAMREVREEAGIDTELITPIDKVEYWYFGTSQGSKVRFHKYVHFFLLQYISGEVSDHDREVKEARWVSIDQAQKMLAFKSEKDVVAKAREMIEAL